MAGNVGKRRALLAARARGLSLVDAAQEAGYSTRQAERLNRDPVFQAELRQRLVELDAEEALARREYGRQVAAMARFALAKQVGILNDQHTPASLVARVAKDVEDIDVRLRPAALDLTVVGAQLEESVEPRSFEEIYGLPPDADKADVIDTIRATYVSSEKVRATYEQIRARREGRQAEFPKGDILQPGERPGLQLVAAEPEPPVMDTGVQLSDNQRRRLEELQVKPSRSYDEERELEQLLYLADPMRVAQRMAEISNGRR